MFGLWIEWNFDSWHYHELVHYDLLFFLNSSNDVKVFFYHIHYCMKSVVIRVMFERKYHVLVVNQISADHIDGLVQDWNNSIGNAALEFLQTKPSILSTTLMSHACAFMSTHTSQPCWWNASSSQTSTQRACKNCQLITGTYDHIWWWNSAELQEILYTV